MAKKILFSHMWNDDDVPHLSEFIANAEAKGYEVVRFPEKRRMMEEDILKWAPGCCAHVCGADTWNEKMIKAMPEMKVISRIGVGYDTVDVKAATENGVCVTTTPGGGAGAVSEFAITAILAMSRKLFQNDRVARTETAGGKWDVICGDCVYGKTLGIVGFGLIGKQLAVWARGFHMNIIAYDPFPDVAYAKNNGIKIVGLEELARQSDFISLHLPLMPSTVDLFDARMFGMMKPSAYIVNASRGGIINEADLYEALVNKEIAGATLDVFTKEPVDLNNPLLKLDNVILAPHAAGSTREGVDNIVGMAFENVTDILAGVKPRGLLNPGALKK